MDSNHSTEEFKLHDSQNFEDFYELNEVLGSGKFGTVYKCKHKQDGYVWAAKIIKTIRSKDKEAVKRELEIMSCLRHSTLLRCIEAYQTHRKTVMVMECITGGELFERITGDDITLTEGDCINFMRQICYGVQHMHESNILHLDLKPENIMCLDDTGYAIKIIDFGLAQRFKEGDPLKVMFGTPEFVAPEIVRYENIGFGTDMWAVGVICYTLLSGLSPFMGDDDNETLNNVTKGLWDFEDEAFDEISKDAKNFIENLLVFQKEGRMSATQCLEHSWLMAHEKTRHSVVDHKLSTDRLKKFVARRRWQKTTHAVRAIGRMSILRLATQQRKLSASPTSSSQTEGNENDDKISSDKNNSKDKFDSNYNQHINDSPTKTTESKRMDMEDGSKASHPSRQLEYPSLSSERITNEGFPSVTVRVQKDLIDEGSQPTGDGDRINKDVVKESQKNGTRALNTAGYGFNTTSVVPTNTRSLRERKIRSGVNALAEISKVPLVTSLDSEIDIPRHTSNEVEDQNLECRENVNDSASEGGEVRDPFCVREDIHNQEVKKEESIGNERTKDNSSLQPQEQQPVLKSILKRRPKSPVHTSHSNLSDSAGTDKERSSKSQSRQIIANSNKQSGASKREAGLWELRDPESATETILGETNRRSRKDLCIAEADLTKQELREGKEQAIMNGNLGKEGEELTRCDVKQGGVIALSEQTSRSFEENSGTPVPTAVEFSEQRSSEGNERISVNGGSVQKKLPLLVEGSCVNDSAKSTRVETDDERYSTSSCSSDSHEPVMQPLSSSHSHPNAMESYLSHKRGTRSSSPYSRRMGNMSSDDSNNNVSSKQVVAQAPVFLQKFHHVEVGLPATFEIKFECKIDGYPKPEVLWYKDGKRVNEGHDRYKFQSGPNGWFSLIIPRAMEIDKGSFMCEARNSAGKARCSAKLILLQDSADTDGSLSPKSRSTGPILTTSVQFAPCVKESFTSNPQFTGTIYNESGQRSSRPVSTSFFKSVSASLSGNRKSRRTSYEDKLQAQRNINTDEKSKGSSQPKGTLGDNNSYLEKLRRLSSTENTEPKSHTLPRRSSSVNPKLRRRSPSVERASRKFEKLDQNFDQNPGRKKDFFTMMRPRNSISSLTAKFETNSDMGHTNGTDKPRPKLSRSESIGKSSLDHKRSMFKSSDAENGWTKETTKTPPRPVRMAVLTQTPSTSSLVSKFQNQAHIKEQPTTNKVRSSPFLQASNKAAILAKFESNSSPSPKQEMKVVTVTLKPKFISNPPKPVLTTDIDADEFSPPSFVTRPSDQSNFEKDSAKFICQVDGTPKPRVSWHFRGSNLKDGGRYEIYEEKGKHVLEIHELESGDAGLYTCRVQNASGRVSASVQLEVNDKPKSVPTGRPPIFLQKISDVEILEANKSARFDCKVTGVPKPEVAWLIEGKSLTPGPRHTFGQTDDGRCALVISDVTNDDDAIYTCLAKNDKGQACSSAELVVDIEEPTKTVSSSYSSSPSSRQLTSNTPSSYTTSSQRSSVENQHKNTKPPEFVARPQSLTATLSKPSHFSCIVRGKPEPEITWEKDGEILESNERYNIHTEEGMSLLKILKTSRNDEGKYVCKATNDVGSADAAFEVQLEVSSVADEADGDIPRSGSVESVEEGAEDPLFISEDISSSVPKKPSVLSDEPSTAPNEENSPEFQITVSIASQAESMPQMEEMSSERDTFADTTISSPSPPSLSKKKTPPEFIELPKSLRAESNCDATFLCMIQGDPKPSVAWKKDGEHLTKGDRYDFSEEEEEVYLKIHDVTQNDQGLYTCTLTNSEGEVSASAELTVEVKSEPPKFVEKPRDCHVNDGEKAEFSCEVSGHPMPSVQWLYRGQPLPSDGEVYVVSQTKDVSTLTLLDVIVDDEGEYVAVATNSSGETRGSAMLTVTAPPPKEEKKEPKVVMEAPSFTQPLTDVDAVDGAPLSLAVRVAGKPKPKMSWFFNGEQIKEDEDFKFVEDGDRYSLVIAEVFPDDGGEYICRITNDAGSEECSANVTVKEPVQEGTPPSFAQKPRSVSTDEGCSISLNCHVAGDLPILVTWHKDGQPISHGKRFKLETSGPEGLTRTLHIPAVLATDAGSYLCTIENKFGVAKCTVSIVVKQLEEEQTDFRSLLKTRPRLQNLSDSPNNTSTDIEQFDFRHVLTRHVKPKKRPQLSKLLDDQCVDEGNQAVFECNVDGYPEPRISWLHDKKEIKESKFFRMTYKEAVARLEISEAFSEDEGEYSCIAVNSSGETRCSAKLKVKRTDSDNNLSERRSSRVVPPVLNGRHTVSDTLSEEPPIRKMSSTLNITLSPPVKSKPIAPVTLELDTNSVLNVTAPSNSNTAEQTGSNRYITRGDSTDISTDFDDYEPPQPVGKSPEIITELEDVHFVEGAPARLRCKVIGKHIPDVTWYKDETELKEGKKYKVDVFEEEVVLTVRDTTEMDAGNYRMVARNSKGNAETSARLLVTAPPTILHAPGPFWVAVGGTLSAECKFSGAPPPSITWKKLRRKIQNNERFVITSSEHSTVLAIKGVEERDAGKYTLVLENDLGSDEAIISLSVVGQPDPPIGKPIVSNIDSSSVVLSWSGSSYDGGSRITGYVIESRKSLESKWSALEKVDSTSHKVKGLEPNTEYHFRVRAENDFGTSDAGRMTEMVRTTKSEDIGNGYRTRTRTRQSRQESGTRTQKKLTIKTEDEFGKYYELKEQVGKGRFGTVYSCVEKATGKRMAAKFITVTPKERDEVKGEIGVMGELSHPKLLECYDAFEGSKQVVMVLEYVSGGELFERVIDDDFVLTESDVIKYIRQVCEGVKHMHDKKILHLDLKPENIMCVDNSGSDVKLIDFGLARKFDPKEGVKVMFGTPEFVAPEVINFDEIGFTTDMWSVGVIAYILLSGLSPFMGDDDSETLSNVTLGEWDFEDEAFDEISEEAKDFISKLLVKEKGKRLTAEEALQHKWLNPNRHSKATKTQISTDKLKKFVARRRWQKTTNALRAVNRMSSLASMLAKSKESVVNEPNATRKSTEPERNGSISLTSIDRFGDTDSESMTSSLSTTSAYSSGAVSGKQEQEQCDEVDKGEKHSREALEETDENENKRSSSAITPMKPKFKKTIVDCIVFEGDCARFDCVIEGKPEPEISWYLDEELIEESDRFITEFDEDGHCSLIIRKAEENDEGDYVVIAKNEAGQVSCAAELLVEMTGDGF